VKKDLHGKLLRKGDVVIGTNLLSAQLKGVTGVVISDTAIEDYIGVQLEKKLLPESAHPEILFAPSSMWRLHLKGGAED